jgi:acetyl-CoA carboxylase biotin carboxyl carrier protein
MKLTDEDVREILRLIDESDVGELHIETAGFTLHVRKGGGDARSQAPCGAGAAEPASTLPPVTGQPNDDPEQPELKGADGAITIDSPMLGTFYRAQEPGGKPFVEVGTEVQADTIVCIIEVMKMMNSIPAGVTGTIVEVCAENADVVEHGEPLFRVKASA